MKHKLIILLLLLTAGFILESCSGTTPSVVQRSENPVSDVQFFDSISFDKKLAAALNSSVSEVTTQFPASVNVNDIPERLDKWFYMVEKFGGNITLEPEYDGERGLIAEAVSLLVGAYDFIKEKVIYDAVKVYNATVYYEKASGKITKVVFIRKAADSLEQ